MHYISKFFLKMYDTKYHFNKFTLLNLGFVEYMIDILITYQNLLTCNGNLYYDFCIVECVSVENFISYI